MSYVPTSLITNRTVRRNLESIIITSSLYIRLALAQFYSDALYLLIATIIPTVILSLGLAVRTGLA